MNRIENRLERRYLFYYLFDKIPHFLSAPAKIQSWGQSNRLNSVVRLPKAPGILHMLMTRGRNVAFVVNQVLTPNSTANSITFVINPKLFKSSLPCRKSSNGKG